MIPYYYQFQTNLDQTINIHPSASAKEFLGIRSGSISSLLFNMFMCRFQNYCKVLDIQISAHDALLE
jgi:hypothetical protein